MSLIKSVDPVATVNLSSDKVLRKVRNGHEKEMREVFERCQKNGLFGEWIIQTAIVSNEEDSTLCFEHEKVPFLTVVSEWAPMMFRDAALFILELQERLQNLGLYAEDIHPANITYHKGKFVFLDFSGVKIGTPPRNLMREFIRTYINPVILMSCGEWLRVAALSWHTKVAISYPNIAGYLTPFQSLHYRYNQALLKLVLRSRDMKRVVKHLKSWLFSYDLEKNPVGWGDYYGDKGFDEAKDEKCWNPKQKIVNAFIDKVAPKTLLDAAGNAGLFSFYPALNGIRTVCLDIEPEAVNRCYEVVQKKGLKNLTPAVADLTALSPGRTFSPISSDDSMQPYILSLKERLGSFDMVIALAVVHHLCLSQSVTFEEIINQFDRFETNYLCIEFPTRSYPFVRDKIENDATKRSTWYTLENFVVALEEKFEILEQHELEETASAAYKKGDLLLFLCKRK